VREGGRRSERQGNEMLARIRQAFYGGPRSTRPRARGKLPARKGSAVKGPRGMVPRTLCRHHWLASIFLAGGLPVSFRNADNDAGLSRLEDGSRYARRSTSAD